FEIGVHYFKLVLLIVLVGVSLGTAAGTWLGRDLTQLYTKFYRFPIFQFHLDVGVALLGFGISALAAGVGTLGAVRKAVLLPPAEAMRPEPPADYRPTLIERTGLGYLFSQTGRMILRHLERQPFKSALSCVGISLAAAVLVLGNFSG